MQQSGSKESGASRTHVGQAPASAPHECRASTDLARGPLLQVRGPWKPGKSRARAPSGAKEITTKCNVRRKQCRRLAQTPVLWGLRFPEGTCGSPRPTTKSRGPTEQVRATIAHLSRLVKRHAAGDSFRRGALQGGSSFLSLSKLPG